MNARIDCPEDLLVHRRRRSLTAAEERTLADHTMTCDLCRMSLSLGGAVEPLPPVGDADTALAARWVAGALAPRAVPGRSNARSPQRQHRVVGQRRWLATAAALLLTAGVAAAAAWQRISSPPPAAPAVDPAQEPAARARGRRSGRVATPAEALPAAPEQPVPEQPVAPPPELPAPPPVAPPAPRPAHPIAARQREARQARSEADATTAADLFSAANRARRERRFADAAQLYQILHRSYSGSEEATQSLLSLADMLLAQGQADAALARFDAYLASAAPVLAEEALVGRARALARIEGRGADERAAWRELLDRYPRSTYGWRARQRLADLDAVDR